MTNIRIICHKYIFFGWLNINFISIIILCLIEQSEIGNPYFFSTFNLFFLSRYYKLLENNNEIITNNPDINDLNFCLF